MLGKSLIMAYLYKACPRCRGDLMLEAEAEQNPMIDERVEYVCLQCGGQTSIEAPLQAKTPAATTRAA